MEDRYDLKRFVDAQKNGHQIALKEIRAGRKRSHWMWYIFPQLKQLGHSATAQYYGIGSKEEAEAYLENEYLKNNLIEVSEALLSLDDDISLILGYPDDLKLRSSMTLFSFVDPDIDVFQKVLNKFYNGEKDRKTIDLLR